MAGLPPWRTLYKLLWWRAPCPLRRPCGLVHMPQRTVRRCSISSLVSKLVPIGRENLSRISTRYASATPAPRLTCCKRSMCQPYLQRRRFPVHRSSRACAACCARRGIRNSAPTNSASRRPHGGCGCHPKSACVHHRTSRASEYQVALSFSQRRELQQYAQRLLGMLSTKGARCAVGCCE